MICLLPWWEGLPSSLWFLDKDNNPHEVGSIPLGALQDRGMLYACTKTCRKSPVLQIIEILLFLKAA
jgi:hypothetical protein